MVRASAPADLRRLGDQPYIRHQGHQLHPQGRFPAAFLALPTTSSTSSGLLRTASPPSSRWGRRCSVRKPQSLPHLPTYGLLPRSRPGNTENIHNHLSGVFTQQGELLFNERLHPYVLQAHCIQHPGSGLAEPGSRCTFDRFQRNALGDNSAQAVQVHQMGKLQPISECSAGSKDGISKGATRQSELGGLRVQKNSRQLGEYHEAVATSSNSILAEPFTSIRSYLRKASASTRPSRVASVTPVNAASVGATSAGVAASRYSPCRMPKPISNTGTRWS